MNKKYIALGSIGLLFGGLVLTSNKALAYRGDPTVQGPYHSEERHEEMTKAFDNNDYNAWKELMGGRGRVSQVINAENFARFAEAHKLALAGNTEEATKIRQELGLGLQNGSGKGMGQGFGGCEECPRNINR